MPLVAPARRDKELGSSKLLKHIGTIREGFLEETGLKQALADWYLALQRGERREFWVEETRANAWHREGGRGRR